MFDLDWDSVLAGLLTVLVIGALVFAGVMAYNALTFSDGYPNKVGPTQTCYLDGYQLYNVKVFSKSNATNLPPIKIDCKVALKAMIDAGAR